MPLFKYVVPDRIDVLSSGLIRFTQPTALNDPFELHPYFDQATSSEEFKSELTEPRIRERLRKSRQHKPLLDALNVSPLSSVIAEVRTRLQVAFEAELPRMRHQMVRGFGERIGILSLSEIPDSLPMWAHYASHHQGFVIIFDEAHEFFHRRRSPNDQLYHLRKVDYTAPARGVGFKDQVQDLLFFQKDPSWSYEREQRILLPLSESTQKLEDPNGPIHLFSVPPECLLGVIIGSRGSKELSDEIAQIAGEGSRFKNFKVHRACLNSEGQTIQIEPPLT